MTRIEWECLLEWCEALIRYHQERAAFHRQQSAIFERLHGLLCYPPKPVRP